IREPLDRVTTEELDSESRVNFSRPQQLVREGAAELRDAPIELQFAAVQQGFARERKAVGMEAVDRVARAYRAGLRYFAPFGDADGEPGQVVFAALVDARHLRGLAA